MTIYNGYSDTVLEYSKEFNVSEHFEKVQKWFFENKNAILKRASYPYNISVATQIYNRFGTGLTHADLFRLLYNV